MIKTQIQLPDRLYHEAKRVAEERGLSLAEVVRRGVEYVVSVFPPIGQTAASAPWKPPPARHLGAFRAPAEQWREIAAEADTTVPQELRS